MLAGKSSHFAAIAANGHRTPAAAARPRIVVEEQTTPRIGANPQARVEALGNRLRPGSGHGGEHPVQASLPRDECDLPKIILSDEFIVPLGNAQYFVYRLNPFSGNSLLAEHDHKHLAEGGAQPPGFPEQRCGSLRVGLRQIQKLGTALGRNNFGRLQKVNQALQDSSPLGRVSLTKSRVSRPPSSRGAEMERGIDGTSSRKRYLNQREITSKNQYNGYPGKSALCGNLFLILKSDMLAGGDGSYETPIGRLSS